MEKEDQELEEEIDGEDDLLDFDLDDISPEDIEEEISESEEEIIELVDLVKEGKKTEDKGDVELEELLVEEGSNEEGLICDTKLAVEVPKTGS